MIDPDLPVALSVRNASFTWDGAPPPEISGSLGEKKKTGAQKREEKKEMKKHLTVTRSGVGTSPTNPDEEEKAFKLNNVNLKIPRGQVCILPSSFPNLLSRMLHSCNDGLSTIIAMRHSWVRWFREKFSTAGLSHVRHDLGVLILNKPCFGKTREFLERCDAPTEKSHLVDLSPMLHSLRGYR